MELPVQQPGPCLAARPVGRRADDLERVPWQAIWLRRCGFACAGGSLCSGTNLAMEAGMHEQAKHEAVARTATVLGVRSAAAEQALSQLWDAAFQEGRLAALDELQDRFCVCMK